MGCSKSISLMRKAENAMESGDWKTACTLAEEAMETADVETKPSLAKIIDTCKSEHAYYYLVEYIEENGVAYQLSDEYTNGRLRVEVVSENAFTIYFSVSSNISFDSGLTASHSVLVPVSFSDEENSVSFGLNRTEKVDFGDLASITSKDYCNGKIDIGSYILGNPVTCENYQFESTSSDTAEFLSDFSINNYEADAAKYLKMALYSFSEYVLSPAGLSLADFGF